MRIESINVGKPVALDPERPGKLTGIVKMPVAGPVQVGVQGLAGDAVMDRRHHGGPGQALYLYSLEDYAFWAEIGIENGPGVLGENLTVSGVESANLCIGDRFEIGPVVLEVTSARIPCATLARRMGDPGFVKRFRKAGRPGAYLRVIKPGAIAAGTEIAHIPYDGDRMTIGAHFALGFERILPRETRERLLALPIAERDRAEQLEKLGRLAI